MTDTIEIVDGTTLEISETFLTVEIMDGPTIEISETSEEIAPEVVTYLDITESTQTVETSGNTETLEINTAAMAGWYIQQKQIPSGMTLTIPNNQCYIVGRELILAGTLQITGNGDLVIVG